jgi:putative transposase
MKAVATVLGVARSNLAKQLTQRVRSKGRGRPAQPETELVTAIRSDIATMPTYGYPRVHAILKRQAVAAVLTPPNH